MRTVITVDGLAGTGKTTLARLLAEKLGFIHLNTGLLYRGVALLCLRHGVNPSHGPEVAALIRRHTLALDIGKGGTAAIIIDGEDCSSLVRAPEVSEATSIAAAKAEVRELLVDLQRKAFPGRDLVAEGRDMGTVIFPDSPLKFYVVAADDVRIQRRLSQLYGDVEKLPQSERNQLNQKIKIEIVERDKRDAEREVAPTKAAPGSLTIDNSTLPLTQVVEAMYSAAVSKGLT